MLKTRDRLSCAAIFKSLNLTDSSMWSRIVGGIVEGELERQEPFPAYANIVRSDSSNTVPPTPEREACCAAQRKFRTGVPNFEPGDCGRRWLHTWSNGSEYAAQRATLNTTCWFPRCYPVHSHVMEASPDECFVEAARCVPRGLRRTLCPVKICGNWQQCAVCNQCPVVVPHLSGCGWYG